MMRLSLYKIPAASFIVVLWMIMMGCEQSGRATTAPAANSTVDSAQRQGEQLDLDGGTETIQYSDLTKKLRPLKKTKRTYRLGAIMKFFGSPYYQRLADGMNAKAKELGLKIFFQAGLTESDQEGQRAVLEDAFDKGYDAILVSPQTDTNLLSAANAAREREIVLINVDDALLGGADYYIGPDQYESGVLAANYFIDTIGQGGKIAVIKGNIGNYGVERRTRGFEDTLAGTLFEIIARKYCTWDLQIALQSATQILSMHPDLKGFYCNNDTMALGVAQAVKQAGKTGEVIVVGRDGIDMAYHAINKKEMTATVDIHPFDLGKIAVALTVRILDGQDIQRVVFTSQKLISIETAVHN